MGQKLFIGQSASGICQKLTAKTQTSGGAMKSNERFFEGKPRGKRRRESIKDILQFVDEFQSLTDEMSQGLLMDALSYGVDRCQAGLRRWMVLSLGKLIVRVTDLKSLKTGTDFAKTAQTTTMNKLDFLVSGEVEETQSQTTAGILDVDQMVSTSPLPDLYSDNFALDEDGLTRSSLSNRSQLGPIFVAQWQMKKEILNREKIDPFKFLGRLAAHSSKRGDRSTMEGGHFARAFRDDQLARTRTASIST